MAGLVEILQQFLGQHVTGLLVCTETVVNVVRGFRQAFRSAAGHQVDVVLCSGTHGIGRRRCGQQTGCQCQLE